MNDKIIEFISPNELVKTLTPIRPMKDLLPSWYKEMKSITNEAKTCPFFAKYGVTFSGKAEKTIKSCPPVFDYLTSGYIIPWSYEVIFGSEIVNENNEKIKKHRAFCRNKSYIDSHPTSQIPIEFPLNFADPLNKQDFIQHKMKTSFFKVNSPWLIKTPPGYSCLFFQPFFYFEDRYSMLPAIVDTDQYVERVNFPGYMIKQDFKVMPNEPLIGVLPFKRDNFKMNLRLEEKKDINFERLRFRQMYKKLFSCKKKYT